MTRRLNVRYLACLMVGGTLFATTVHFVHGYQVRRNARTLLAHAQRADADGHPDEAVRFLNDYLTLVPEDTEALATLGQTLDRLINSPRGRLRVLLIYDQVLRRA